MHIRFTPARRDARLQLAREGDRLTVNGETFDFAPLPEGATLPASAIGSDWFAGPAERIGGVLHLSLILPHGPDAPEAARFPAPLADPPDGSVALPGDETAEEAANG